MPPSCAPARARPALELADIVRAHGEEFRKSHVLRPEQHAALRAIEQCRTAVLGGHLDVCTACGYEQPSYNSCRNPHLHVVFIDGVYRAEGDGALFHELPRRATKRMLKHLRRFDDDDDDDEGTSLFASAASGASRPAEPEFRRGAMTMPSAPLTFAKPLPSAKIRPQLLPSLTSLEWQNGL